MKSEKAEKALQLFASLQDTIQAQQQQQPPFHSKSPSTSCAITNHIIPQPEPSRPTTSEEKNLLRRAEAAECLARRLHEKNKQLLGQMSALERRGRGGANDNYEAEAQLLRDLLAERDVEVQWLREQLHQMEEKQKQKKQQSTQIQSQSQSQSQKQQNHKKQSPNHQKLLLLQAATAAVGGINGKSSHNASIRSADGNSHNRNGHNKQLKCAHEDNGEDEEEEGVIIVKQRRRSTASNTHHSNMKNNNNNNSGSGSGGDNNNSINNSISSISNINNHNNHNLLHHHHHHHRSSTVSSRGQQELREWLPGASSSRTEVLY
ncbi:uncharacterized protein TEOVI_000271000 [Trypanosoma equiperdum]|uniref:Uncharacterized protein n=1 Tax=Trypanosoma equiperdum TaxID=5694 RepID=A0A1G4IFM6_TRYEQ|nr:hypothetical protein, conserved [Trypanosoma equiperdum]